VPEHYHHDKSVDFYVVCSVNQL